MPAYSVGPAASSGCRPGGSGGGLDADCSRVAIASSAVSRSALKAPARSLLRSEARASRALCRAGSSRWRISWTGSVGVCSAAAGAVARWRRRLAFDRDPTAGRGRAGARRAPHEVILDRSSSGSSVASLSSLAISATVRYSSALDAFMAIEVN